MTIGLQRVSIGGSKMEPGAHSLSTIFFSFSCTFWTATTGTFMNDTVQSKARILP